MAEQFWEVLLGRRVNRLRYIFPSDDPAGLTREIGDFWIKRWLSRRVEHDDTLTEVERHTLVYPVEHDARVALPEVEPEDPNLFNLLEGSA